MTKLEIVMTGALAFAVAYFFLLNLGFSFLKRLEGGSDQLAKTINALRGQIATTIILFAIFAASVYADDKAFATLALMAYATYTIVALVAYMTTRQAKVTKIA